MNGKRPTQRSKDAVADDSTTTGAAESTAKPPSTFRRSRASFPSSGSKTAGRCLSTTRTIPSTKEWRVPSLNFSCGCSNVRRQNDGQDQRLKLSPPSPSSCGFNVRCVDNGRAPEGHGLTAQFRSVCLCCQGLL
jgi:hypothetical protein